MNPHRVPLAANAPWRSRLRALAGAAGAAVLLLSVASPSMAQEWLSALPQVTAAPAPAVGPAADVQPSFYDLQRAFETYYRQHPVDLNLDRLAPTVRLQGPKEEQDRRDVESYKMFKRWEWLMEPRVYPTGRLDHAHVDSQRARVPQDDESLILKQAPANPLKLTIQAGKIIWPLTPTWKLLGPKDAIGGTSMGRVNCIAFDPTNSAIIYICAPDGGVWKTTDGGATWSPKFDTQTSLSVGDIASNPATPTTLYVATSDAFGYGVPFWGGTYSVGVVKSTDGGTTWTPTNLTWTVAQNRTIRRLAMHPTNALILLAATSNGLYRTADGGATWAQLWATSTYDVEFQPNNGSIVYATTTTVLKSTDAGLTFSPLGATCGGTRYNIEIAPSNPNVLYTLCTNGTVQKSTNAGGSWATVTAPAVTLYGYYDNVLAVSPVNEKIVYVAGFDMKRTTDGGTTWASVPMASHPDNHAIRFFAGSSTSLLVGNDGGLFKTTNGGSTWSSLNKGLAIMQFYRLGISKTNPNIMISGAQDNGNVKYNAGTFSNITNADGMKGFIDWSNSNVIYAGIQNGSFYRSTNGGATFTPINTPSGGAWVSPWAQDPMVAKTIYAGTDKVYRSTNQGTTWVAISGALAGVPRFTTLKVAPSNSKVIYAGDGSKLYRTSNAGAAWTDVTAGLPVASNYLTYVTVKDTDPNTAYVTFSGYVAGQKVYKTTNGGAAWTNISGTLTNMPVNCITYEKNPKNALYIGTDAGVYYINDGLSDWIPYKFGLPNVIVDELEIHYGAKIIRAATYGRGLWEAPLKTP